MVELHDIIDNLERRIRRELGCIVTIHMDPVAIEDEDCLLYTSDAADEL